MFSLGLFSHVPLLFSFSSQENLFGEIKKNRDENNTNVDIKKELFEKKCQRTKTTICLECIIR